MAGTQKHGVHQGGTRCICRGSSSKLSTKTTSYISSNTLSRSAMNSSSSCVSPSLASGQKDTISPLSSHSPPPTPLQSGRGAHRSELAELWERGFTTTTLPKGSMERKSPGLTGYRHTPPHPRTSCLLTAHQPHPLPVSYPDSGSMTVAAQWSSY